MKPEYRVHISIESAGADACCYYNKCIGVFDTQSDAEKEKDRILSLIRTPDEVVDFE